MCDGITSPIPSVPVRRSVFPLKSGRVSCSSAGFRPKRAQFWLHELAGDGEEAEAAKAANPSAVMLGWLSTDAVATELAEARALVFPSLWYECYPLVLADALRLGVPVIISDRTVADYLVLDGVSGLHVRGGDVHALASAMKRLQDDSLVQSMSDAAFAAGGELLGLEDHVTRLFGIYRSLIGPGACDERHEAAQGGIGSCC
jgi:glycosyltransferase involved in cell wall biosynthesis